MSGDFSVNSYGSPTISCSMSARTFPFIISPVVTLYFLSTSLVGSTTLSMTYSINVRPYNDPYIQIAEVGVENAAAILIAGAFLVDIIPILKYLPGWFPGAKFHSKAATMRELAAMIRDVPFAATEELMVIHGLFGF